MMRKIDKIVLALFLLAMIVLCFFQECSQDIYVLVLAFAVAAMAGFAMWKQRRTKKEEQ